MIRKKVYAVFFRLASAVPPLARTELGSHLLRALGAKVGQKVFFGRRCRIPNPSLFSVGDDTSIGEAAATDGWAPVEIGSHVIIGNNVELLTGGHDLHDPGFRGKHGSIVIRDYVWIAGRSMILGNVEIGRGAIVGAGSVVRQNVPEFAIVLGNPAKVVGHRKCRELTYSPGRFFRDRLPTM